MPATWTDTKEKQFLLAIIQETAPQITKKQWETIKAAMGNEFSISAMTQHLRILKKLKIMSNGSATGKGSLSTPDNKSKKKSADGSAQSSAKKRKSRADADGDESDVLKEEDESEWERAAERKKVKKETFKSEQGMKEESPF